MTTITIAYSAVNAKLVNAPDEAKRMVQQELSYTVDGAEFMTGTGGWNGRSSFFEWREARFPRGFVTRVFRLLSKHYRVQLLAKPLPAPLGPLKPVVDPFPEDPRYSYQGDTVDALLRYGQMIAQVATGGGKSRIAKLVHARIARPTLFLTTRGILMHQMRNTFIRDMRVHVGIYGDDEWSSKPSLMNVGMVQTFAARLEDKTVMSECEALARRRDTAEQKQLDALERKLKKEKASPEKILAKRAKLLEVITASYPPGEQTIAEIRDKVAKHQARRTETIALLQKFEVLILEEAHEAASDSFYNVTRECINAHYRIALTATPFMKDSELDNLRLEAVSGTVAVRVTEKQLIDMGILAKPYFVYWNDPGVVEGYELVPDKDGVSVERKSRLYRSTPYQRAYEIGVTGNISRNRRIVTAVAEARDHGLSSMVLVAHKMHGTRLLHAFVHAGIRALFIQGEDDQAARDAGIHALKTGTIDVLIGSTILDVGVDVPAVGLVVLAGGMKAEVAIRQRIGRGLRAKKSGPNVCFILDFTDHENNHLRAHARERRAIVEGTPGFAEGIVSAFPYDALGLKRLEPAL